MQARRVVATACWLSAGMIATVSAHAQPQAEPARATYSSLETLPDWSGWWGLDTPISEQWSREPPPVRPGILEAFRAARTEDAVDLLTYCRPQQFTGYSGGFTEAIELLFTPGRVTLTNEIGLIRRIYTDGRPMPTDVDTTNTGMSVGHWEGETLVVETIGINPQARYPSWGQGSVPIGKNVRITERISLKDAETLEFEIVTIAPDILTEPDRRTRLYSRVPKTTANEITFCTEYDRSIDPASGKQRFDMTPPADLPPPPAR